MNEKIGFISEIRNLNIEKLILNIRNLSRVKEERLPKPKAPERTWGEIITPYLIIKPFYDPSKYFVPNLPWFDLPGNDTFKINVAVRNEGNSTSHFTFVELYECPPVKMTLEKLKDSELIERKDITLHPGEEKKLTFNFVRKRVSGQAVIICYDPFFDPKTFKKGMGYKFIVGDYGSLDRKSTHMQYY